MFSQEQAAAISIAIERMVVGMNPQHPDWYDGMFADGKAELEQALTGRV